MGLFSQRGIAVSQHKGTAGRHPVRMEHCETVTLLMKQHIGVPCVPLVKPGDLVQVGQVVGDNENGLCVPIHASISGKILRHEIVRVATGEDIKAVVIASDGKMESLPTISPPTVHTFDEFIAAVRASGLVGLGGAGFPAYAKLKSCMAAADILLVNAAECEPYITADHNELLESAQNILDGVQLILHHLKLKEAIIGIEDNKGDAIRYLQGLCGLARQNGLPVSTKVLKSRYPQGAEKMFIHALTGRVVPLGKLPAAVGVLPMNVGSVAFLGRYFQSGMPLVRRTVTVDGGAVTHPMNARVPIGVKIGELIAFTGGEKSPPSKIILGGPMMGNAGPDLNTAICKCNNAVLLFTKEQANIPPESDCIRCGSCVAGCPMGLQPCTLEKAARANNLEALEKWGARACIECGSCSYICPAKRELVQRIRLGKRLLAKEDAKRKAKEVASHA